MKKGMGWPIGIALILLATVGSNIAVIVITKDDPSFAVEPDYYRKAVAWDSTQRLRAASDALDWHVRAQVQRTAGDRRTLTLTLVDGTGASVQDAVLTGALLHVARAAEVQSVTFAPDASGAYVATVPMAREGVWELRLTADRDGAHFIHTLRLDTSAAADAALGGP